MHLPIFSAMFERHLNALRAPDLCITIWNEFHSQTNHVEKPNFVISAAYVRASEHSVEHALRRRRNKNCYSSCIYHGEWRRKCRRAGFYSLVKRYHHRVCVLHDAVKGKRGLFARSCSMLAKGMRAYSVSPDTRGQIILRSIVGVCVAVSYALHANEHERDPNMLLCHTHVWRYHLVHWRSALVVHIPCPQPPHSIRHCFDFWIERIFAGIFREYKLLQPATGYCFTVLYHCRILVHDSRAHCNR